MSETAETVTHALLSAYLRGQDAVAARLFGRIEADLLSRVEKHRMWPRLRRLTQPADVVQEVFLLTLSSGLLRRIEDRGRGSIARLFGTVLDRVIISNLRRFGALKRSDLRLTEGPFEDLADSATTPTERARATDIQEHAKRLLAPDDWDVWRLVNVAGRTQEEAARQVGKSVSAVARTLQRANAALALTLCEAIGDASASRGKTIQ